MVLLLVEYIYENKIVKKRFTGKDGNDIYNMLDRARKDENYTKCISSEYKFIFPEEYEDGDK